MSRVTVLTGGVGGAKLVLGLTHLLGGENVTAIVNTGDDMVHMGLHVSPDIDTLLCTLAGKADDAKGWGRADETWTFMESVRSLGGPDWFQLGDGDLALHVIRSAALADGITLSEVTARFAQQWGVAARMLPMTDTGVATRLSTDAGELDFQTYFVGRRCEPAIRSIAYVGAQTAKAAPGVLDAISDPGVTAIVIAPSNPWLSIDPILAVPGIREAIANAPAPVVTVSPVRNGQSFKGPTAKIMIELGLPVDSATVASHYAGLIDGIVVDSEDACPVDSIQIARADIAMPNLSRKIALASDVMTFAARIDDAQAFSRRNSR